MVNGLKVITLCGSTRFKDEFLEAQKRLTLEGNVVISVGTFDYSIDKGVLNKDLKEMLIRQHLAKIDLADEIFVINVGGNIDDSTRHEIAYAEFKGKKVRFLEYCKELRFYDYSFALYELYESGNLSENDWEKHYLKLDEKIKKDAAELNACDGPWPYKWNNIDAVVGGLLRDAGWFCDYEDTKDFYDANYVYQMRIIGKGANDEEKVQSIIDAITNDYMDLFCDSKRIIFYECCSPLDGVLIDKIINIKKINLDLRLSIRSDEGKNEVSFIYCY
jgi:hypothetical protein